MQINWHTGHTSLFTGNLPSVDPGVRGVLEYLLSSKQVTFEHLTSKIFKGILWKKDPELLHDALALLDYLLWEIHKRPKTAFTEVLVGNILCLYPFFEPAENRTVAVPKRVGGFWRLVLHKVQRIPLTPALFCEPYYAYHLVPRDKKSAPLLIYMGTAHPTAHGALWTYWTDFFPGMAIGESLYQGFARAAIERFLNKQERKVHIYGQSLGGSLALQTVAEFPDKVAEVHAYSPGGVFERTVEKYHQLVNPQHKPIVNLYTQENDLVPSIGWARGHADWHIYKFFAPQIQDFLARHARAFSSLEKFIVVKLHTETKEEKWVRSYVSLAHQVVSFPLHFFLSVVLAIKGISYGFRTEKQESISPGLFQRFGVCDRASISARRRKGSALLTQQRAY